MIEWSIGNIALLIWVVTFCAAFLIGVFVDAIRGTRKTVDAQDREE